MGLSKKCKQHLSQITARAAESNKRKKVDQENQQKRRFLRKRRGEDFLDEYEAPESASSSDESILDEPSLDEPSSEEENSVDNQDEENTYKGLGDNDGGVLLEVEDRSFRPTWNDNAGGYLRGIRGCGSSATKKRG